LQGLEQSLLACTATTPTLVALTLSGSSSKQVQLNLQHPLVALGTFKLILVQHLLVGPMLQHPIQQTLYGSPLPWLTLGQQLLWFGLLPVF
jgi:hypothetical protein